jgi:hypothetical protein
MPLLSLASTVIIFVAVRLYRHKTLLSHAAIAALVVGWLILMFYLVATFFAV